MVKLTPRLKCAVDFVRPGRLLADVGTDHAYLPIYLCETGILTPVSAADGTVLAAIASDINPGPVDRATIHVSAAGLADRIRVVRTDGLTGLGRYAPEDIVIFGMGGELIAAILAAAPWVARAGTRLILQPMTHPEKLRAYLESAGFAITAETLCAEPLGTDGERIYQIICADFAPDAQTEPYTPAQRLTGRLYPPEQAELHRRLIERAIRTETACRDARRAAGRDTTAEDDLLASLTHQLTQIGGMSHEHE